MQAATVGYINVTLLSTGVKQSVIIDHRVADTTHEEWSERVGAVGLTVWQE